MATEEKKQEVKPLTFPSPSASPFVVPVTDEEAANSRWSSVQYLRKRRSIFWCCGCCGATVVVLGLVILILAFTVFKVKDPTLTLNNLYLDRIGDVDIGTIDNPVSINATLTADISIENPNVASFKYGNSTTEFYYEGQTVGVAYAPDGDVGAHKTVTMNVTVEVLADRVGKTNAISNVFAGSQVNVTTYTDINGRVDVWGIYKRDIEVMLNCSMSLDLKIRSQEISNKVCVANVR